MYLADLEHPSPALQDKLTRLYNLRPGKEIELGFRPEFLQLLEAYGQPVRVFSIRAAGKVPQVVPL